MLNYHDVRDLLDGERPNPPAWKNYIQSRSEVYGTYFPACCEASMISEANWVLRNQYQSGEEIGVRIDPGDICYMDFGQAYLNEMGYQHFGLCMNICRRKAFIIPMTSNPVHYAEAYDEVRNPCGKIHLMQIGKPEGLNKPSVLYMNDARYINTARVIEVKAHIPTDSELFREIRMRFIHLFFQTAAVE
ncbi:MAG: hypothetical protein PUG17_10025 [Stecheria intestinalis]|jgi:hypothetical protein|uniref:hypothetical protein n=1 Tax=Stecheria intestinalis TaxID=2606630 RepID=UPI0023EF5D7A|nr:hypothetical protein [Stecheria intestinalis]MDY3234210.1 hypothetical protein [Erysipelotrichaceae bacterium]MDY4682693.1 hypothetical protein [Lachnospiraceae bacterium]MDD5881130.1 hypothetical protein [Stecheria intestinalis]MDD6367374.1 hypothetical protein [Stecheria intestinalis]MDD7679580.1 hypothetical protein [Stecheria intestinalis]